MSILHSFLPFAVHFVRRGRIWTLNAILRRFLPFDLQIRILPHIRASDTRTTVPLASRGVALERAAARICREAGARVTTNTRVADLNLAQVTRQDDRRIEVIANGLNLWGATSTNHRHHPCLPFDTGRAASPPCRHLRRGSSPYSPPE
jgi:hypothetical protein